MHTSESSLIFKHVNVKAAFAKHILFLYMFVQLTDFSFIEEIAGGFFVCLCLPLFA